MTAPFTFHASVSDNAISKVSRLFNATLDDVFAELFQNARRAGAAHLSVDAQDDPELGPVIRLADDGPGLDDPKDLFLLGHSAWAEDVRSGEDAAGMGFFALSGRRVRIIVQRSGTDRSWIIDAQPQSFSGTAPISCSNGPFGHRGLTILIQSKPGENFVPAASHAARYFPLPVDVDGVMAVRKDFLSEAEHVEDWNGIRIGVYATPQPGYRNHENVNFHGVTLAARLPYLTQEFHRGYYVRLDAVHCAKLKLVLPARKEIVQDAFFDALCARIRTVLYRCVAEAGEHSMSFKDFERARSLGIMLPEATMLLRPFLPACADRDRYCRDKSEAVCPEDILYLSEGSAIEEQNLAHALSSLPETVKLYDPVSNFNGYVWYGRLPRLSVQNYGDYIPDRPVRSGI